MSEGLELLKRITEVPGISGFEDQVRDVIREELGDITEITQDYLGSIICKKRGTSDLPKIMLPGHMDEIGFMVSLITKEGFLKFVPIGGWWDQVLLGQRVIVKTSKGDVPGVIGSKPPHIIAPDELKKVVEKRTMFIDVGAKDKETAERVLGIRPGDPVVPVSPFTVMGDPKYLLAKAWDDRVGCALFIDIIRRLNGIQHPNTVYGVGTVQEEVGLRGAKTSADLLEPDICFTLEVAVAGDTPGVEDDESSVKLGAGPVLYLADHSMIAHSKLREFVIDTAKSEGIPLQYTTLLGGGTDAGAIHIHNKGVPSVVLAVASRYIHTHQSIIHLDDYTQTVELVVALIKKLDKAAVEEIRR